eukprot:gene2356-5315_t
MSGEVEAIEKWRQEFEQRLKDQDEQAQVDDQALREAGKKELEELHDKYKQAIQDNFDENKKEEEAYVNARDDTNPKNAWQRVAALVEFSSKASRSTRDTSRMRSVLLQLKQHGLPNA